MYRLVTLTSLVVALATPAAAASAAYTVGKTVALGQPDHWDYVSLDAASKRVFVSHGDHTDVLDATTGELLGKLDGLHGAHGQAVAATGEIYADSGRTGQVTAFDPRTFKPLATLPTGAGADAVISDPDGRRVVVLNGEAQTATLVDTATRQVAANVPLGGEPEFAAADGAGRIYVNIASTGEIAQIDAAVGRVTARFGIHDCVSPHGLTIDPATRRLFVTCLNARLLVVDAAGGRVLQSLPIGRGSDAAAFDPVHREVFSSNGDGTLDVFALSAAGVLTASGEVKTAPGARTMAVDPRSGRVFLVAAEPARRLPDAHGGLSPRYDYKPGTVKLLMLDRAAR